MNPTDQNFTHSSGIAEKISRAGGRAFQTECAELVANKGPVKLGEVGVVNSGGDNSKLQCLKVINAVVGIWERDVNVAESISSCMKSVVNVCNQLSLNTVAIPLFNTGIYGGIVSQNKATVTALYSAVIGILSAQGVDGCLRWVDFVIHPRSKLESHFDALLSNDAPGNSQTWLA